MQALVIAEDNEDRDFLSFTLRHAGFVVTTENRLDQGPIIVPNRHFDVIILSHPNNKMLLNTVVDIRRAVYTPLFVLAENPTTELHCRLLDAGADLVFTTPASPKIITRYARILLNRSGSIPNVALSEVEAAGMRLIPADRTLVIPGADSQRLTQLEFRLLYVLMTNPGQVIPVEDIVERVWGYDGSGNRDLVRGLVRRLRRKIEREGEGQRYVHNIPGIGYQFSLKKPPGE